MNKQDHTGFRKHPDNPVFGDPGTGTLFDVFVTKQPDGWLRMDVSQRSINALASVPVSVVPNMPPTRARIRQKYSNFVTHFSRSAGSAPTGGVEAGTAFLARMVFSPISIFEICQYILPKNFG